MNETIFADILEDGVFTTLSRFFYRVKVFAVGDDQEKIDLGVCAVRANSTADAQNKALDLLWDHRLDSASCSAQFETDRLREVQLHGIVWGDGGEGMVLPTDLTVAVDRSVDLEDEMGDFLSEKFGLFPEAFSFREIGAANYS